MVRELSHYVGGHHKAGSSGRFGDVFDPCTGAVQARVPLAGRDEVASAVAAAVKAQEEWAATNAQRRGRILLRFVDLVNRNIDELARLLSSEHGKTLADAKGDITRGLEVVEFAAGAPHLLKGEFSTEAGPGMDIHSLRQPLGVVAGITPFNHDSALEVRARSGRRQRVHPQAFRAGPLRATAPGGALLRSGHPGGCVQCNQR
jgi:malonate-semialdehyde dehydrogenase (acetylating)/methylmalonate-semialdehyde dehydrogenase